MREVRAVQAERPVVFNSEPPTRPEFLAAFGAFRIAAYDEHHNLGLFPLQYRFGVHNNLVVLGSATAPGSESIAPHVPGNFKCQRDPK